MENRQVIETRYYFQHRTIDGFLHSLTHRDDKVGKDKILLDGEKGRPRFPIGHGTVVLTTKRSKAPTYRRQSSIFGWIQWAFGMSVTDPRFAEHFKLVSSVIYESDLEEVNVPYAQQRNMDIRNWLVRNVTYSSMFDACSLPPSMNFAEYPYLILIGSADKKFGAIQAEDTNETKKLKDIIKASGVKRNTYRAVNGAIFFKDIDDAALAKLSAEIGEIYFINLNEVNLSNGLDL